MLFRSVGGAGSGKTANGIDPMVLSAIAQGHSVALLDVKFGAGGQAEIIVPYALAQGYEVRILAPGQECSQTFNLADRIQDETDVSGARELIQVIVDNMGDGDAKKDAFFDPAGIAVLSGAFLLAISIAIKEGNPDLANILMVNQILSISNLSKRLIANREEIDPWVYSAFSVLTGSSSSEGKNSGEAGILATAIKNLTPLIQPRFLPAFCGKSSFPCFDRHEPLKVDGKQLIVFGIDQYNEASTVPLVATAMQQIISYNLRPGRETPLVISLDEFSTLNLKDVLKWLNKQRSNGCSLIIGVQYLGQLTARYGKDWAEGFLASCATKMWFNPGVDETAQYLSKSLGEEELQLESKSKSINGGQNSSSSRTIGEQIYKKPLLEAHVYRQFPQGMCVIESPGVGTNKAAGVPYQHHFVFSKAASIRQRDESAVCFARVQAQIVRNQQELLTTDYSLKLSEYTKIVERRLPDPTENNKNGEQVEPLYIMGNKLIEYFTLSGISTDKFSIETSKKYYIPLQLIDRGALRTIAIDDIPTILEYADYNQ